MWEDTSTQAAATRPAIRRSMGGRIALRMARGLWRGRKQVALSIGALVLGGFVVATSGGALDTPVASTDGANGQDQVACADATMTALVNNTPATVQQAYQCLAPSFQQRVSEQQFASQLPATGASGSPTAKLARIGTYQQPDGSTIVYYALQSGGQAAGYVVYLDQQGRVVKVE